MRTIRLHLVGAFLAFVGFATSMPQLPHRHHNGAVRNPSPIQLDDDDDDRENEAAILEEERASGEAASSQRRRRA